MAGKRLHFIINPISGHRRRRRRHLDKFVEQLAAEGHDVHVGYTQGPKDATRLAREACEAGAAMIGVAGGDGTLHEAVAGVSGTETPIMVIPCGTENVVAKFLRLRLCSRRLCGAFGAFRLQTFRMMEANGRKIIFACGLGVDGEIIREMSQRRKGHISYLAYIWPVIRTLVRYKSPDVIVSVDGKEIYSGPASVLVGKVPRYALGIQVLWKADPASELIDVAVLPRRRMIWLLWDGFRMLIHPRWRSSAALYEQGKTVEVTSSQPVAIQMDGEYAGTTPLRVSMTDQVLRFITARDV